jgi:Tol biopolymer transport system component
VAGGEILLQHADKPTGQCSEPAPVAYFADVRAIHLAAFAASVLVLLSLVPGAPVQVRVAAQPVPGRVLASSRGQVAWLDLSSARATPLTSLVRPTYATDVAAAAISDLAVASIVSTFASSTAYGADLVLVDLLSGATTPLVGRHSAAETLEAPAIWPDGSKVVYQRTVVSTDAAEYQTSIEQVPFDGTASAVLLDSARYPTPSPDGSKLAFVRRTAEGIGLFAHTLADGNDVPIVPPGPFFALSYPRYSPDGKRLAFAALSGIALRPNPRALGMPLLRPRAAAAHGNPWEVWLVDADGSHRQPVPEILADDPSVAWSPDGAQLLIYGGYVSYLVNVGTGEALPLPALTGYGAAAWLPD